jgi:26S proteasome non-ATPase regulatory subunit 9
MGLRMDDIHDPTLVRSGPTSQSYGSSAQPKQTLKQLIEQKENLEAELSALGAVLDSHGVNMRTGLTTFDGFPRADIDVPQIRTTRARIIRLKNDHKALMAKLEVAVHEQFAAGRASEASTESELSTSSSSSVASRPAAAVIEPPFARVNTVVVGSPAEQAGLQVGDKVTKFGTVNWTNHERLSKVASTVQQNENVSNARGDAVSNEAAS